MHAGCVGDFHTQVVQPATTAGQTAPVVTALRAILGAQEEKPAASAGWNPFGEREETRASINPNKQSCRAWQGPSGGAISIISRW